MIQTKGFGIVYLVDISMSRNCYPSYFLSKLFLINCHKSISPISPNLANGKNKSKQVIPTPNNKHSTKGFANVLMALFAAKVICLLTFLFSRRVHGLNSIKTNIWTHQLFTLHSTRKVPSITVSERKTS